ncbi:MAG: hypothetical protein IT379_03930 [Deltaproteobacteria bacterium]|nr:hypothetical protein [Deltaproteobacteria bacterium]
MTRKGLLVWSSSLLAVLAVTGCSVDPYCFTCPQGGSGDGGRETGTGGGDAGEAGRPDTGMVDPDACVINGAEVCNGMDDDCNGMVDDGNPGGGGTCGVERGECRPGTLACMDGELVCTGANVAMPEACNGRDDDCDGETDEGNPEGGGPCGTDEGECRRGTARCDPTTGAIVCEGGQDPVAEVCNARDDDCDGCPDGTRAAGGGGCVQIDLGMSCGMDVGACAPGRIVCRAGAEVCEGATMPRAEACNGEDDDCDGMPDDGFDLTTDPRNCGRCGNACEFDNAVPICADGECSIRFCRSGFHDLNGDPLDGCEYACEFRGAEACNGRDDDCDGMTDEGLVPPTTLCNATGACAGTTPTCRGALGYGCMYGPTVSQDADGRIVPETTCDNIDNDCNGRVDDNPAFITVGMACGNGIGGCRSMGMQVCTADGMGTVCNAPPAGAPGTETCNGIDDDCDGVADETRAAPGMNPSFVTEDVVAFDVNTGGGTTLRYMYRYEASRPDATASAQGASSARSCSRAGVQPWVNVTYIQARDACASAGMRLCTELEWLYACRGPAGDGGADDNLYCEWAVSDANECNYTGTSDAPPPVGRCNTNELDWCPSSAEPRCATLCDDVAFRRPGETVDQCRTRLNTVDQDGALPTGSLPMCIQRWDTGGGAQSIFDLTGNVREWAQARSAGVNPIRGGSYENVYFGATCNLDFSLANDTFQYNNLGFRCCSDSPP